MQDLAAPDDPGPRVVGRRRWDEEAQRGEREDGERNAIAHGDARHSERRHSGTGCCQLVCGRHGAGKRRLWRNRCCPPLRRTKRSRATTGPRHPLQSHDSPCRRARLASGPDGAGGGCGRPALVRRAERLGAAPVRQPGRRDRLGRRHGPRVVVMAGRHRQQRSHGLEPRLATLRRAGVRPRAGGTLEHRRRCRLRADAGDRADRPLRSVRPTSGAPGCPSPSAPRTAPSGASAPSPTARASTVPCSPSTPGRCGGRLLPGPRHGQRRASS